MLSARRFAAVIVPALTFAVGCESLFGPGRGAGERTPLTALPRALSVHEQQVISGSNRFAFDILRETIAHQDDPNVFLSPLSASMALGMTMNGARGETFDGMRQALGFDALDRAAIMQAYRALIDLLTTLDAGTEMLIANSVWARQGFPFHDAFLDESRHHFDAEVATLDFASPVALARINAWVDDHTKGRIPTILDAIPPDYVMFLINAIYFEGKWRERFDRAATAPAPFTQEDGAQLTVQMMRRLGTARVNFAPDALILELPYGRDAFAMTIVLPHPGGRIDDLVTSLDVDRWNGWLAGLQEQELHIGLPRFRLEYETLMNEPLIELGMGRAFGQPRPADFTGMSSRGDELEIGFVKQKTFVEVDEDGTIAAAATAVGMRVVSAPPAVEVNRPFIVAIRERLSGTILFIGRISAPNDAS